MEIKYDDNSIIHWHNLIENPKTPGKVTPFFDFPRWYICVVEYDDGNICTVPALYDREDDSWLINGIESLQNGKIVMWAEFPIAWNFDFKKVSK